MTDMYSAHQIAKSTNKSRQAIDKRSKKEQWPYTEKSVRGGKQRLFALEVLPEDVQQALRKQAAVEAVNQATELDSDHSQAVKALAEADLKQRESLDNDRLKLKESSVKAFSQLPDGPKKQRAKAREWVVHALWIYRRNHQGNKKATRLAFVELFNQGDIDAPQWVLAHMPKYCNQHKLTGASLQRWEDKLLNQGIMALVDNYGQSKGHGKIDQTPELQQIVLGAIINNPHITAGKILQYIEAVDPKLNIISKRALQRYIKAWKEDNEQLWLYVTHPDQWKNVCMAAFGSHHEHIIRPNQLWEMDSTPGDWMLTDGRHTVLGVIDMFTRRLKLLVSKTSKAESVKQVFRRAVLAWGVPEAVRTDNGKDYVSQAFVMVLRDLEIQHELCLPFASEQKGTIERTLGTMSHGLPDLLPGFIGHNVAERKAIEARKSFAERIMKPGEVVEVALSSEELQAKLDQWCEHIYAQDEHGGLQGKTPYQVATAWTGKLRRISDERALDVLLYEPAGTKTVTKKGVRLDNQYYIAPALVAYIGQPVRVKRDELDVGIVYLYEAEGGFICRAECHALLGTSPAEVAAVAKKEQKKLMATQRREYQEHMRRMKVNIPEAILQHRIEQSKNVTQLPRDFEEYSTPALEEAGKAARSSDGPQSTKTSIDMAAFEAEFYQPVTSINVKRKTPIENYKYWALVEKRIQDGLPVDDKEKQGLERYKQQSEYKAMSDHYKEFGLTVEGFGK